MSSALESEDLENVPLVRMEDVQPSRTYELISRRRSADIVLLESCVIEDIEYDNECIVNDDEDSNIGSMVSIQSEEVVEDEDEDSEAELIVPEMVDDNSSAVLLPLTTYQGLSVKEENEKPPSSWPTLEILPGGVIKKPENCEEKPSCPTPLDEDEPKPEEMMYACAKCPQRFKFLFCLVKHVKWHEDENKKLFRNFAEVKTNQKPGDFGCMHSKKRKLMITVKPHKKRTPKKMKS